VFFRVISILRLRIDDQDRLQGDTVSFFGKRNNDYVISTFQVSNVVVDVFDLISVGSDSSKLLLADAHSLTIVASIVD